MTQSSDECARSEKEMAYWKTKDFPGDLVDKRSVARFM
jgi:hypothetical protein